MDGGILSSCHHVIMSWGAMRPKMTIFKGGKCACSDTKIFNMSSWHHVIMSSCQYLPSFRKIARTGLSSETTRTADPLVACLILNFWSPKIEEALVDEMPTSVLNRKFIFWTLASHVHRRPIPWHFLVCRENCFVNRDCSPNPPFPLHLLGLVG